MDFKLKQTTQLSLALTPRAQLGLKILAMNQLELQKILEEALVENPALEESVDERVCDFDFESPAQPPTLQEHLLWQVQISSMNTLEREIASVLVYNLDERGYLDAPVEFISNTMDVPVSWVESVRRRVKELDPAGCSCLDVKEYCQLQLKASRVRKLNLSPAQGFLSFETTNYQWPDVHVVEVGDGFKVVLSDSGRSKLKISRFCLDQLKKQNTPTEQKFIQDRVKSALSLIRAVYQRQKTLVLIAEKIVFFQEEWFKKGASLRPLTLKKIAAELCLHESTISRAIKEKSMMTPRGLFELKYFFPSTICNDVSSHEIEESIKKLIAGENSNKPLSDLALSHIFKNQNIKVARRTITKHRERLGILPSYDRRQPAM